MTATVDLSFVIPVYNEHESLFELHGQIRKVVQSIGKTYEIIFINDGSSDSSWQRIVELRSKDDRVKAISFRRNFGKAAALSAGFQQARGEIVFTLDADLQDDPVEIPHFLAKLDEGFDVVSGWKKIRHDPWHKVLPSRVFNAMVSQQTGVKLHDHNCGFKAYRREVLSDVCMYGERHRFVPVLAAATGYRVSEVVIHHRARPFGKSKYGWNRFLRGFLDLQSIAFLTQYRYRPMHWFGSKSLLCLVIGVAMLISVVWFVNLSTSLVLAMPFVLASLLFYLAGLQAETNLDSRQPRQPFTIRESIGCDEESR